MNEINKMNINLTVDMTLIQINDLKHPHATAIYDDIIAEDLKRAEVDTRYYLIAYLKLRYFRFCKMFYLMGMEDDGEWEGRLSELGYIMHWFLGVSEEELQRIKKMACNYVHGLKVRPSTAGFTTAYQLYYQKRGDHNAIQQR